MAIFGLFIVMLTMKFLDEIYMVKVLDLSLYYTVNLPVKIKKE